MSNKLSISDGVPIFDNDGNFAVGGQVFFYVHGTTTNAQVFADTGLTIPYQNPVPIGSGGTIPSAYISGAQAIDIRIATAGLPGLPDGNVIRTIEQASWFPLAGSAADRVSHTPSTWNDQTDVQAAIDKLSSFAQQVGIPGDVFDEIFSYNTVEGVNGYLGLSPYVSDARAITNGGSLTFAHGLTGVPDYCEVELVCVTADAGFIPGQVVDFAPSSVGNRGISILKGGNNIVVRAGSAGLGSVIHATTGQSVDLTTANWEILVRAQRIPR